MKVTTYSLETKLNIGVENMYWWSSQKYYTKTYNKGLFDSFENEDQISESYLVFSDKYSVEKHGTEIKDQMVYITY